MDIKLENRQKGFIKLNELLLAEENASIELFVECLSHPYQFIRMEAIRYMAEYKLKKFTRFFAMALNDECDYVVQEASEALGKLNTDEALEILFVALFEDRIERPHHIASAIATFGERGFEVLEDGIKSSSANIRYFSTRGLGSTGMNAAIPILESLMEKDKEKTTFGAMVSTAAKKGLKTLVRVQNAIRNKS